MAGTSQDLQQGFSDAGTAVSDLYNAQGDAASAAAYQQSVDITLQNEAIEQTTVGIKQAQANRQLYQTLGGQVADVAGAGFAESGSGADLLRDSAEQGAITHALISEQGSIQENAYQQQAVAYEGQAQAASAASSGAGIAGAISGIAGLVKFAAFIP